MRLINSFKNVLKQDAQKSNIFMNLDPQFADNFFEICNEEDGVDYGQGSLNFQVRQLFTNLRLEIQKLFNQQQISYAMTHDLPQALQDDYYELMGYIKDKIQQIKAHNEISFIMAEAEEETQPLDHQIHLFPQLSTKQQIEPTKQALRKLLEQKDTIISSLVSQKTGQQNTINQLTMQKQEIEQENENRFMNQCEVYKRQIRERKKDIDILEMNLQCVKNVLRNVLQAYTRDEDMQDDFRESMTLYAKISKISQKDVNRINLYIQKYLEIKGLV